MKKAKWAKTVLAALLAASLLAGCAGPVANNANKATDPPPADTTSGSAATDEKKDDPTAAPADEKPEPVTITALHAWNGGQGGYPTDLQNNPVTQRVTELTGITVETEFITTSESERLNVLFASGSVPDLVNAPCWSMTSGEGKVIKKGILEGQVMEITPEMQEKYPTIKTLMHEGIAKDFMEFEVMDPAFGGKMYLIPQQTPGPNETDISRWSYGVYCRGDILKALGVDPKTVDSSEKVYELLKQIKAGGFKDANGNDVIPGGAWHNGWDYSSYLSSWEGKFISDYREEDGKLVHRFFTKAMDEKLAFMRKMFSEGLMDMECFANTDTMAKEKYAQGKIAVFAAQSQVSHLVATLYKDHPEMQYELLGPLKLADGSPRGQVEKKGRSGWPAMFIGANSKNADAVLRYISFCNSLEGKLLADFGIEGVHYDMVDGKPKARPEVKTNEEATPNWKRDQGIGYLSNYIGYDDRKTLWPKPEEDKTTADKLNDAFLKEMPLTIIDKISANYLERSWERYDEYRDLVSTLNWDDEYKRAIMAKSDAEAAEIIKNIRDQYVAAGINDLTAWVEAERAKRPDDIGL